MVVLGGEDVEMVDVVEGFGLFVFVLLNFKCEFVVVVFSKGKFVLKVKVWLGVCVWMWFFV